MRHLLLVLPALCACRPVPLNVVIPLDAEINFWPHAQPTVEGGELVVGQRSGLLIRDAPVGAQVNLYLSEGGEGPGPCNLPFGACLEMREPVAPFGTTTADKEGVARFRIEIDDIPNPGPIAWQAMVVDPELEGVYTFTDVAIRHVGIGPEDSHLTFRESTTSVGIQEIFTSGNTHTGGVAFVDLNNDFWPDLYVSNGAGRRNFLYLNEGDGTFTELHDEVGKPAEDSECAGVKAADIDNDGDIDLIVPVDNPAIMVSFQPQPTEGGPNLLYLNELDQGTFGFADDPVKMAADAGLQDPRGVRNSSAAVADIDLDGCIDVYFTHWAMAAEPGHDNDDRMLKGQCDGTFVDVTEQAGTTGMGRDGLVGFFWDHDFDRYPELYVGNNSDEDEGPVLDPRDVFYRNDGTGSFTTWDNPNIGYDAWAAMGVDIGDIDADGDWDLYITDVMFLPPSPHGNVLYYTEDDGELSANRCHDAGLCFGYNSWPTNFEDFDNDGWIDIWVGSSLPRDPDMLYINQGDGTFVAHRQQGFIGHIARSGTTADYDGDGDMDAFLFDEGSRSSLWENDLIDGDSDLTGKHWVELKLRGAASNRAAIGTLVKTEVNGVKMMRRVTGGDSAHAHRMLMLHFGLGNATALDRIEITWPQPEANSPVQVVEGLTADRLWIIDEGLGILEHAFVEPEARWENDRLEVSVGSNYGGRPAIEVEGFGELDYEVETVRYEGRFTVASAPAEVTLLTDYGAPLTLPVVLGE